MLNEIRLNKESKQNKKRVGRGIASGTGKTCGRGHKGQKSRTGGKVQVGFEGGQMPLYRKLPRRGFNNFNFRKHFQTVNVGELEKIDGDTVNRESLLKAGLIRHNDEAIKLLGEGEVTKALNVQVDRASGSAIKKIEAAGGKLELATPVATAPDAEATAAPEAEAETQAEAEVETDLAPADEAEADTEAEEA